MEILLKRIVAIVCTAAIVLLFAAAGAVKQTVTATTSHLTIFVQGIMAGFVEDKGTSACYKTHHLHRKIWYNRSKKKA